MLQQRLAEAESSLAEAEKWLEKEKATKTSSNWADAADIEDAEDEVDYWKGVVDARSRGYWAPC
jgi:Tfp pilus assembly protein PilX